jgi:putative tryptophan/tyrosine transport system substrate-binding protein
MIGLRLACSITLALVGLLSPVAAEAQQAAKVARIGYLVTNLVVNPHLHEAFRQGLRDLGYVEGRNLVIEYRDAEGKPERLPALAAELVALKVDVIVTGGGTPPALAAKQATTTIPIVMAGVGDAVATGLVSSLARPGGNITGLTDFVPELTAKRLELLKQAVPRTRRVGILVNLDNPSHVAVFKALESTAKSLNVELQTFEARGPNDFERAFSRMAKSRVDAIVVTQDSLFNANVRAIAALAAQRRLASSGTRAFAEAGGAIGYGMNFPANLHRAAYFVDKILKGAKPSDLPVEQPTKFELVVNLKTAKTLGLTIPQSLLLRADQVIE